MTSVGTTFDILSTIIPLLFSIAYLTLLERKILASIQLRRGPNIVGILGIIQPLADGIKLLLKEIVIPYNAYKIIFYFSPLFVFFISLTNWLFISPHNYYNLEINLFYLFAISTLGVYGIIMAGWSSNSKYGFLGSIRALAQMLSYELTLFFSIFPVILLCKNLNLQIIISQQVKCWFICVFPTAAICFLIAALAETNRTPFDLPEAEGELVSGYNIEFSSMIFALFFLSEYSNILLASAVFSVLFLGGWTFESDLLNSIEFSLKITSISSLFVAIRAILPRYRYDQLILIGWLILLPISIFNILYYISSINIIT